MYELLETECLSIWSLHVCNNMHVYTNWSLNETEWCVCPVFPTFILWALGSAPAEWQRIWTQMYLNKKRKQNRDADITRPSFQKAGNSISSTSTIWTKALRNYKSTPTQALVCLHTNTDSHTKGLTHKQGLSTKWAGRDIVRGIDHIIYSSLSSYKAIDQIIPYAGLAHCQIAKMELLCSKCIP